MYNAHCITNGRAGRPLPHVEAMLPDEMTHGKNPMSGSDAGNELAKKDRTGRRHLTKRSDLASERAKQEQPVDILIVDDEPLDAERLTATLHVLFGYHVQIRWARSLSDAVESLAEHLPTITFLDDILKPSDDAFLSIPQLREAGYEGPIIVVSGAVTQSRRSRLIAGGATDVIHKDDVDSVRVAEAVNRARASDPRRRE